MGRRAQKGELWITCPGSTWGQNLGVNKSKYQAFGHIGKVSICGGKVCLEEEEKEKREEVEKGGTGRGREGGVKKRKEEKEAEEEEVRTSW